MATQVSLLDGALASAGTLAIQTNGTTSAITISTAQVATFVNNPIMTGLTASRAVFTDGSKGLTSNAITGTGNVVMSASPTLTGTIDGAALTLSSSLTLSGGTANGVLYLNGSKVATSGSALVFDGTNLGIGVTPSAWRSTDVALQVRRASLWDDGSNAMYLGQNVYENTSGSYIYIGSDYASIYRQQDGVHAFYTAPSGTAGNAITFTQAMTLDASGNLLVGTTSSPSGSNSIVVGSTSTSQSVCLQLRNNGAAKLEMYYAGAGLSTIHTGVNTSSQYYVFNDSNVGVYLGNGATSWSASSDERVKTDLVPITNGAEKVSSIRAVTGRYKTDDEGTSRAFLIAQDVQAVLPEAVNEDPNGYLGLQYTDVIPLLVAAIQEQQTIINQLKARLDAANL